MPLIKICPVCKKQFKTAPSQNNESCSLKCGAINKWRNPKYRKRMSDAHKGMTSWRGRKHKRESILKMRKTHLKSEAPLLRKNGYVYFYSPDHPRQSMGRVPEQILIAEKTLGRFLKNNEVVHHINGIKTDNRNSNLLICTDSYHRFIHAKISGLGIIIRSNPERDSKTGRYIAAGGRR